MNFSRAKYYATIPIFRQAVDRQKACLSAVATDRPSEQRPEAENVSLQASVADPDPHGSAFKKSPRIRIQEVKKA